MMIELVSQPEIYTPTPQRYMDIAASVLQHALPEDVIQIRCMDENESFNLEESRLPDGRIDMREYTVRQKVDRDSFEVPEAIKTSAVIAGASCIIESGRTIDAPYGYSNKFCNEAITSISSIQEKTPSHLYRFLDALVGYTIIHETGHLFGLVSSEAERSQVGGHCKNICVMQSTATPDDTLDLISEMGGRICFCSSLCDLKD